MADTKQDTPPPDVGFVAPPLTSSRGWRRVLTWPGRYIHTGRNWFRRGLRYLLVAFLVMLGPVAYSFTGAMVAPGSAPLSARAVEWLSNHGFRSMVVWAEALYLNSHKPKVGGEPSGGIPTIAGPATTASGAGVPPTTAPPTPGISPKPVKLVIDHLPKPPDVVPIVQHPLPHEGVWQPYGREVGGIPAMYAAFFRPDRIHTSLVAGVVWMDQKLLRARLVPGVQDPGGNGWSWFGEVPRAARPALVAAFNSGFYLRDSLGGFYADGQYAAPLRDGAASLVIDRNGVADVGKWGRDFHMGPNVESVRQNLSLIVDGGKPVPNLSADNSNLWGATYGNTVLAWRSAVGVTRDGALLFGASDGLSSISLANIMIRAGAVRAMEMDINHTWVSFEQYTPDRSNPDGAVAKSLLSGMWPHPQRYLHLDERDFVAMLARSAAALPKVPASSIP
ncbi:MAG TPA: phosphodiester glycosidase family protein [Actinomycetota bacterium]|nr:phosphodiester glycosidase family protein [Actinomycetota bacterium]